MQVMMFRAPLFAATCMLLAGPAPGGVLVPRDTACRYFKGVQEASMPDTSAWRLPGFDDAAWLSGTTALYYENQPGSANAYTGQTSLPDMNGGYTCVFLRQTFVLSNPYDVAYLDLEGFCDDGFLAWVNGHLVGRFNMPADHVAFDGTSSSPLSEPISWYTNRVTEVQGVLRAGTNVLAIQAFNNTKSGSSDFIIRPALYSGLDTAAPQLESVYPSAGAVVPQLRLIEVEFNKPVTGVDVADLRVNGQAATNLTVVSPSQYVFEVPPAATGTAQVTWAPGHGIKDLTTAGNSFAGAGWSCNVDGSAPLEDIIISEFLASNSGDQPGSIRDDLGDSVDWIELHNRGQAPVNVFNWTLTDNPTRPDKWAFPSRLIPGGGYLVVYASGRDTNVNGQLHTNFKVSAGEDGYLALFNRDGQPVSQFTSYPAQYTDVSYGRDRVQLDAVGYYPQPTPGAANSTQGAGFAPEVRFSRVSGAFQSDFPLSLTVADPNAEIRYLVVTTNVPSGSLAVTNIPGPASPLYTGPITVNNSMQVRARAFSKQPGVLPGPPRTECYLRITPAAAAFGSDLPIILVHNLGGSTIPSTYDQSAIVMVFEPINGRACMTNPPTLVSRAGINLRGSSTQSQDQPSLALELWDDYNDDLKLPFLGLPAESDWVLYIQNSFDHTYLHNPLAHRLSRDLGRYSSRTRFAEVFLNKIGGAVTYSAPVGGNYMGLYTVEEKVKRDADRVDIDELRPDQGSAPDITGGYLLKIDRADSDERTFYDSNLQGSIVFQDPDGIEMVSSGRQAQYNYITAYFNQFGAALWGPNYTNPTTGYAAYIDVDSWIDHHILNTLAFNVDAFRLSGYFFKDRGKKLEMGPNWDFDRAMGTSGDFRPYNPRLWRVQAGGDQGTDFFGNPSLLGVRWWQRLFNDPDFWQRWIDRWAEARKGPLSTNHIHSVIDEFASQLTQAQPRTAIRWSSTAPRNGTISGNGYSHAFNGTFAGEMAFLKRWMTDRANFIDTNFLKAPVSGHPGGNVPSGHRVTVSPDPKAGTVLYYTLDGQDPRVPGGGVLPGALSASGSATVTVTGNVRLFARSYNTSHRNLTNADAPVGGNPPISSPWSAPTIATFVVSQPLLVISEIMFHPADPPTGSPYEDNDFEFIEIKNAGTQPLSLLGVRFTNGIDFTFRATNNITQLGAGQYLVLVKNRAAFLSRYPAVTNIAGEFAGNLNNAGERLSLEGALGEPILDFAYSDAWQATADGPGFSLVPWNDNSWSQTWGSEAAWRASSSPSGSPGRADPAPAAIAPILINEVLTHTDPPQVDSIEFYNPTEADVPLGGWFLTDDKDEPRLYRIPDGRIVPQGGFLQLTEADFNSPAGGFALSSLGDQVYLFSGDGTNLTGYRHGFAFGPQVNGVSFGRVTTSDGREHLVTQVQNSLGEANPGPTVGPVVLSEIFYSPVPIGLSPNYLEEFVEILNLGGAPAPLYDLAHPTNRWRLDDAVQFVFPPGTTLSAGQFAVVVSFDPSADPVALAWFRARFNMDPETPVFGPFTGRLANEGDRVGLYFPDTPETTPPVVGYVPYVLAETVDYSIVAPWPTNANGTGNSISRIDPAGFANEPTNWVAATPSPGETDFVPVDPDYDDDGLPNEWETANNLDPRDATGLNGAAGDPDGDGATNTDEYFAGTDPRDGSDYLKLEISYDGSLVRIWFLPRAGKIYILEKSLNLSAPDSWGAITGNITGSSLWIRQELLDPAGAFYRLRLITPP